MAIEDAAISKVNTSLATLHHAMRLTRPAQRICAYWLWQSDGSTVLTPTCSCARRLGKDTEQVRSRFAQLPCLDKEVVKRYLEELPEAFHTGMKQAARLAAKDSDMDERRVAQLLQLWWLFWSVYEDMG